jgi:hypothetical protein
MLSVHQTHARQQAYQSEVMITVQMRNENVIDPASSYFISRQLHLRSFATIHQKQLVFQRYYLGSGMTIVCGESRIISENGNSQHVRKIRIRYKAQGLKAQEEIEPFFCESFLFCFCNSTDQPIN